MIKELLMASALICAYPNTHQVKNAIDLNVQQHRDYDSKYINDFERTIYYGNNDSEITNLSTGLYINELYVYDYLKHFNLYNGDRVVQISLSYEGIFDFDYDSITNEYSIYFEATGGGVTFEKDLDNDVLPNDTWYRLDGGVSSVIIYNYVDTYRQVDNIGLKIWQTFMNSTNMLSSLNDFTTYVYVADNVNIPYKFNDFVVECANIEDIPPNNSDNAYLISNDEVLNYYNMDYVFDYVDYNYYRNVFKVSTQYVTDIGVTEYLVILYSWNKTTYTDLYAYLQYYNGGYYFDSLINFNITNNVRFTQQEYPNYVTIKDVSFISYNELFVGIEFYRINTNNDLSVYYYKLNGDIVNVYNGVAHAWVNSNYRYIYSFNGGLDSRISLVLYNVGAFGTFVPSSDYDITNLVYDYANLPFFLMQRLFSFSIFGVQVWSLILSLITILLAIFVIRKVSK